MKNTKNRTIMCDVTKGTIADFNKKVDIIRNLMYENRMLGVPRLRQLRTGNQSCIIHPDFEKAIKRCHASYSYSTEDTSG